MSADTNHGKTTSPKRNNERKSTLTERDSFTMRRIVSKNYIITSAQVTAEDLFPQKLSDMSFTNPKSTVGLQLLNF
jgi:hypothetical protein